MALRAGMDIGTNTFLLLVAEVDEEKNLVTKVLRDEVRVVRLGQGVDKFKAFQPEALARAEKVFREYGEILREYPGVDCRARATSGSRDAKNSQAFFKSMAPLLGFPVQVISGEEEAEQSFRGATSDRSDYADCVVIDIGGGSTEIIALGEAGLIRRSFDVGCVRMTERYVKSDPPEQTELDAVRAHVRELFESESEFFMSLAGKHALAVAGTATYLASSDLGLTKFDPVEVHGHSLSMGAIDALVERLMLVTNEERLGVGGMDAGRADVIVAGGVILSEVLRALGAESSEISVRGLRFGLVL